MFFFFFFQAEDGIRDLTVTGVQTCALPICYGGDAKVLAGGQSLMPLLNFRRSRPAALVDLNRIPSLASIEERAGRVRCGALTRQRARGVSPLGARRDPRLGRRAAARGPPRPLAIAGAGPVPGGLRAAEEILERDGLTDAAIDAAARRAAELVSPDSDIHASADYRRHLTTVLTRRALKRARTVAHA